MDYTVWVSHRDYEPVEMLVLWMLTGDYCGDQMLADKGRDWLAWVLTSYHYYALSIINIIIKSITIIIKSIITALICYLNRVYTVITLTFTNIFNLYIPLSLFIT